jgi:hypothetical protein
MNCRHVERNVVNLVESTLAPEERKALEDHLSQCEKCRALNDFVSGVMNETDQADEVSLSPDFWPRLNRRIEGYEQSQTGWLGQRPRLRPVAVTACLLLGAWAGIHLGNAYSEHVFHPPDKSPLAQEDEVLPYISIFEGVPQGSLAELVIEQTRGEGSEP